LILTSILHHYASTLKLESDASAAAYRV